MRETYTDIPKSPPKRKSHLTTVAYPGMLRARRRLRRFGPVLVVLLILLAAVFLARGASATGTSIVAASAR